MSVRFSEGDTLGPLQTLLAPIPGDSSWGTVNVDMTPLAGRTVKIELGATIGANTIGKGLFIDRVQIVSGCQPVSRRTAADCAPTDFMPCTNATCLGGVCSYASTCCESNADCDDNNPCTIGSCGDNGVCAFELKDLPECCTPTPFAWDFEQAADGDGWTFTKSANNGVALSPVFGAPALPPAIHFSVYLDVETSTSYDKLTISLLTTPPNGPQAKVPVFSKSANTELKKWTDITHPVVPVPGATYQLELAFDTVDGVSNTGLGVLVDEIEVLQVCAPSP